VVSCGISCGVQAKRLLSAAASRCLLLLLLLLLLASYRSIDAARQLMPVSH